jgi:Icc-related predicted phosphoesterase
MSYCFFASDLHGRIEKYEKLFSMIRKEKPEFVFLGGDLLPFGGVITRDEEPSFDDFIRIYLAPRFASIREENRNKYPHIVLILGNDDPRIYEPTMIDVERANIWHYLSSRKTEIKGRDIFGYSYVPPSPFMLKDWEKYDVSRYVDPGCSHPHEGSRSSYIMQRDLIFSTIKTDIENLIKRTDKIEDSVWLFHAPPYKTNLDRADLDGKQIDYAPVDVHIGSIAIKNFIKKHQPHITMHGHVHESTELTGFWKEQTGNTISFQAAHSGDELSLLKFDLDNPKDSVRELL